MSASIYWRYVPVRDKSLPVSAPSSFITAMDRAFGAAPWKLGPASLERLHGLSAAHGGMDRENPFEAILAKMQDNDGHVYDIEVWASY